MVECGSPIKQRGERLKSQKFVRILLVIQESQECGFCGSNTVPPDNRCYDRSGLQSGALPSELKPLGFVENTVLLSNIIL